MKRFPGNVVYDQWSNYNVVVTNVIPGDSPMPSGIYFISPSLRVTVIF